MPGFGILLQRDDQARLLDAVPAFGARASPAPPAAAEEPLAQDVLDAPSARHGAVVSRHPPRGHVARAVHELDVVEAVHPGGLHDLVGPGLDLVGGVAVPVHPDRAGVVVDLHGLRSGEPAVLLFTASGSASSRSRSQRLIHSVLRGLEAPGLDRSARSVLDLRRPRSRRTCRPARA